MAGRYVSVSTVLAYRDWPAAPVDESSAVWECDPAFDPGPRPWEPEVYGHLKAGCEQVGREVFGEDRLLLLRPHTLIGQYEDDGPLLWWLGRMRRGGQVLVPGPDRPIQPVDVRDLSRFLVDQVQREASGVFNVAAPDDGRSYGAMVRACAQVVAAEAEAEHELVWADGDWLAGQGVRPWTELPLWSTDAGRWQVSSASAATAGLRCRPLIETASDTWRWLISDVRKVDYERITRHGMNRAREAELIARWQTVRTGPGSAAPRS